MVLLYNGSNDPDLLRGSFPFERYNAVAHPSPSPARWGYLHQFALDCMRWAGDNYRFDTLTIVDSDPTGSSPGLLETSLLLICKEIRHRNTGQLGGSAASGYTDRTGGTGVARDRSVAAAVARISKRRRQIRPLVLLALDRLHRRRGARFDPALRDQFAPAINHESDAHLGFGRTDPADDGRAARLPGCSQPLLLRLRQIPRRLLVAAAASGARARQCLLDASCPASIRRSSAHANPPAIESLPARAAAAGIWRPLPAPSASTPRLLLTLPILDRMRAIEGWLEDAEADLLIAAVTQAVAASKSASIVEIGSFCGRSTVVIGSALNAIDDAHGSNSTLSIRTTESSARSTRVSNV